MKKENYIDNIPKINKKWETLEDGIVEVTIENKGFYNTLAQKLFKKPRYSFMCGNRLMVKKQYMKLEKY